MLIGKAIKNTRENKREILYISFSKLVLLPFSIRVYFFF